MSPAFPNTLLQSRALVSQLPASRADERIMREQDRAHERERGRERDGGVDEALSLTKAEERGGVGVEVE